MTLYEVTVTNIGYVYEGGNKREAERVYKLYVRKSKADEGRAGGEDVALWKDGDIKEYYGNGNA